MSYSVSESVVDLSVTAADRAWGGVRSDNLRSLVGKIGPVLQAISESSVLRETNRSLPYAEMRTLRETGLLQARMPGDRGGYDATLPELFGLVISVAEADSNIAQALRSHFGFVEHIITVADADRRERWMARLSSGDLVASAAAEARPAGQKPCGTSLRKQDGEWRLNGTKAYATGALFADWIDVETTDEDGEGVAVMVAKSAPGVAARDDWDGFGQRSSASGTIEFVDVLVRAEDMVRGDPFPYFESFYQLYLLAVLAGIARAASNDVSGMLASRGRGYSHGAAALPRDDPQLLQVVGEVRSLAYAAGAAVMQAAHTLQRAYEHTSAGSITRDDIARVDIEVWQAQRAVSDLAMSATTRIFDALSASATRQRHSLDRHWRNAATLVTHNPAAYKARIVGDYAVNGRYPPGQWKVGIPEDWGAT